jgi:prephenate dehydratase
MDLLQLFFEFVVAVKTEIASLKQQLADALADDAADEEAIASAQQAASTAQQELDTLAAKYQQDNNSLADAIQMAKEEILGTVASA